MTQADSWKTDCRELTVAKERKLSTVVQSPKGDSVSRCVKFCEERDPKCSTVS